MALRTTLVMPPLVLGVMLACAACPPAKPSGVRALGGVMLDCSPKDAELYVDDRYAGVVSGFRGRAMRLRVGLRRLQLSREGYFDHFTEVRVVRGVQQKLEIKLRRRPF